MPITVNLDLIRKYNLPGPRYTSYPTAPHFHSAFGETDWLDLIKESNLIDNQNSNKNGRRPLSLYFHFPFCDSLCWFCGCTMQVARRPEPIDAYLTYLSQEIALLSSHLHSERKVVQMHFGGGTPTHLTHKQLRKVGKSIHDAFSFDQEAEIGCEMDPRGLTLDHLKALREIGAKRASLGVQDFNPRVQKAINRIHDEKLVGQVISWIRDEGYTSLNLDLIYGLPFQTTESFSKTVETVLTFAPDRLAIFSYAHVPWLKPHQKLIKESDLPSAEEKLSMLKYVIEKLTNNGYVYIGMDHFARVDDELAVAQRQGTLQRNFQGYSTKAGADIHALGMSAISQLDTAYSQNTKDLAKYKETLKNGFLPVSKGYVLSIDDQIRRHVIMRMMCDMEIDYRQIGDDLGISTENYFADEISRLTEFELDGLLKRTTKGINITDVGRLFIRNIAMTFDAHLEQSRNRYSKTI